MTCKNCNAPLEAQARFCIKCGAPVLESQENQLPATRQQETTGATGLTSSTKFDSSIRRPKRPTPTHSSPQQQQIDENEESMQIARLDEVDEPLAKQIAIFPNTVNEQPIITPDDLTTSEKNNPLYDQPTIVVNSDIIKDAKTEQLADNAKTQPPQEMARPVTPFDITTLPFEARSIPHPELMDLEETKEPEDQQEFELSPLEHSQPLLYYRLNTTMKGSQKLPAAINRAAYPQKKQKRGAGCFLGCLTTFIVLLLIVGIAWVFALRPYIHDIAQNQLDKALTSAVNQIPAQAKQLPPGTSIPINENTINNLIVLNLAPSNPVQNPTTSISSKGIRLDFQLYSFPCAISLVPTVSHGQITVTQVSTEGIFSAIMSPEEMTSLLNKHFNDAQVKLQRTINNVQLKENELDLTLG